METKNTHLGTDLILGDDGELVLSPSGDLAVTQDGRDALAQDIRHLLESLPGDLFSHPEFGAGVARLLGAEQNNHEQRIARTVTDALVYHPSIASRLKANTIRVSVSALGPVEFQVRVEAEPTSADSQSPLNLVFQFGTGGLSD